MSINRLFFEAASGALSSSQVYDLTSLMVDVLVIDTGREGEGMRGIRVIRVVGKRESAVEVLERENQLRNGESVVGERSS